MVGRPVRQSGSRPLLLNEILEHWADEIKPTCLLRWSRQAGCSCTQLEQQVKQAYEQVWWARCISSVPTACCAASDAGRRPWAACSWGIRTLPGHAQGTPTSVQGSNVGKLHACNKSPASCRWPGMLIASVGHWL